MTRYLFFQLLENIGSDNMRILVDLTPLADNFSGIERYAAGLTIEMVKDEKIFLF